jgi:hypothetical protein
VGGILLARQELFLRLLSHAGVLVHQSFQPIEPLRTRLTGAIRPPRSLLVPYVQPADNGLRKRVEHLATRFEELEFVRGQDDWIALLEVLGVNE